MEQSKNRKTMSIIIGIAILVIGLVGVTYAFFNYTRTGTRNIIKTGRIYFNSEQDTAINLTNMFPIDVTNGIPNDNTKVGTITINVVGDTTYDEGIEYKISAVNVQNSVGNKSLPISIDVSVTNNSTNDPITTLGISDNDYYTSRGGNSSIYKILASDTISNNEELLVGYITKGATGIDGNIVIKAYLDKAKIAIVDTYDETESDNMGTTTNWVDERVTFTTEEWNSLQANGVSFQVKVEANEGLWIEEPPKSAYETVKENVIIPDNPINFANISSDENGKGLYILPGTENDTNPIYYYRGNINNNNVIFGGFCWQMVRTTDTGGIKMIYNGVVTGDGETCENTTYTNRIISTSVFNLQKDSMADVGYMKNARYVFTNAAGAEGTIYGKKVEWDGTNYLVIEDTPNTASTNTTKDNNHHYSCGTTGTTSCETVRYYHFGNFYITLTNGELIEDAIYKMTGNIVNQDVDVVTRNSGYVLNNTDSIIKRAIENWFRTNLTNEVDTGKRNYISYLEDTIYCNDRSFKTITGDANYATYQESGWNPNGGDLTKYLYFGTWNRFNNNWYSTSNVPTTACPNETDRFSVSSSVAHLNYPVGFLTADEGILAGLGGNNEINVYNVSYYLYTNDFYWSMSPNSFFNNNSNSMFYLKYSLGSGTVNYGSGTVLEPPGLRPVVSLKLGTEFESGGDGTPTNPYVVKYN